MRSITKEQAKHYILAGYFPKENEIEAICDLQDAFGHLPYNWVILQLADEDEAYRNNTEKLYRLIWHKDVVDNYTDIATKHRKAKKELEETKFKLNALQNIISRLEP